MADEVKKLTGEERIDALCLILTEKYGFSLPESVFSPETDEDDDVKEAVEEDGEEEKEERE